MSKKHEKSERRAAELEAKAEILKTKSREERAKSHLDSVRGELLAKDGTVTVGQFSQAVREWEDAVVAHHAARTRLALTQLVAEAPDGSDTKAA